MKLSALVKARLLFRDEIDIDDHAGSNIFNDLYLMGLIEQKGKIEQQRNGAIRSFLVAVFAMYLVSNGASVTVPGFGITIAEIPGIFYLICMLGPLFLVILSYSHINFQTYDALIEQIVLKKRAKDALIDPDIIRASLEPFQFFLKIFRENFNIYEKNKFEISTGGKIVFKIAFIGAILIIFLAFAIPVSYFCYATFAGTHSNLIDWIFRIYVSLASIVSTLILTLEAVSFEHKLRAI